MFCSFVFFWYTRSYILFVTVDAFQRCWNVEVRVFKYTSFLGNGRGVSLRSSNRFLVFDAGVGGASISTQFAVVGDRGFVSTPDASFGFSFRMTLQL